LEIEKQQLLLSYLVSSQELFVKVAPILKSEYFDARVRPTVRFVKNHFEIYKVPPTIEQIAAETQNKSVVLKPSMTRQEIAYAETEIETFCRNSAIEAAVMAAPALLAEQKFGEIQQLIRDAITVSLTRNIGLDYFHDPEARLNLLSLNNNMIPTKFRELDYHLGGGINRKEMLMFAAPPGVGKSLTMTNLSKNLLEQGYNGVYITLELSEDVNAKRLDSMYSGIGQVEILKNIGKASDEIRRASERSGKFFIKRFPESSTNANHIRAYLKEFEIVNGFVPDFICVDYLDLMCSVQQVSAENTFIRDKFISEELRAIANDYNLMMITASQLNRGALQLESIDDLSQAQIAGGISKVNTTDNLVAIIQTPLMKAQGQMMFKLLKTRSSGGVGNFYMLKFNSVTLVLENMDDGNVERKSSLANLVKEKKENKTEPKSGKLNPSDLPFQI